jgi:transglutaminase-like putative cysteine protease
MGTTWRMRVQHNTRYRYSGTVKASYNEARMTPLSVPGQTTVDARMEIRPAVRAYRYWDYWGTMVHAFDVHVPHDELTVTATAVVETTPSPPCTDVVSWDRLLSANELDRWCELLGPSRFVPADAALASVAAALRSTANPLDNALAATAWVHDHMAYTKGSTTVATPAPEAFRAGKGVCQDFAHILLAVLRGMSIPSRYASGYLYPDADARPGDALAGQSHAWVEAWVGEWVALDPTNGGPAGQQHILVARGRDYGDVPPLQGIYTGAPAKRLDVSVELTRIA